MTAPAKRARRVSDEIAVHRAAVLAYLRECAGSPTGTVSGISRIDIAREIGCDEPTVKLLVYDLTAAGCLRLMKKTTTAGMLGTYRLTGAAWTPRPPRATPAPRTAGEASGLLQQRCGIEAVTRIIDDRSGLGGSNRRIPWSVPRVRFLEVKMPAHGA